MIGSLFLIIICFVAVMICILELGVRAKDFKTAIFGVFSAIILFLTAVAMFCDFDMALTSKIKELDKLRKICIDGGIAKLVHKNVVLSETVEFELISTATAELTETAEFTTTKAEQP